MQSFEAREFMPHSHRVTLAPITPIMAVIITVAVTKTVVSNRMATITTIAILTTGGITTAASIIRDGTRVGHALFSGRATP